MDRCRYPALLAGLAGLCLVLAGPSARAEMNLSTDCPEPATLEGSREKPPMWCDVLPNDLSIPKKDSPLFAWRHFDKAWCVPMKENPDDPVIVLDPSENPDVLFSTTQSPEQALQVQQVPEPSALVLAGMGSLGLLWWRRQARRQERQT